MALQKVTTDKAPAAVGPYSQAITANGLIFTAGQIPLMPGTGNIVEGGVQEQTHQVLRNLAAVLESAGSGLHNVIKTTVFLQNLDDFAAMNEVYATYFREPLPARSTVQVAKLPRNALVEIEVVALAG